MVRFTAAALLIGVLTSCTHATGPLGWGTPHVMMIARANDPPTLNPLFELAQADIDLTQLYAEPLIGLSSQNRLVPLVAARVPTIGNGGISGDGRTITYHLRHDERFADGVALTSKDVEFTYRAILDPRNPVAEVQPYRIIEWLDTPNRYTVVLHLRRRWSAAVSALFAETDYIYGILPAHAFHGNTDVTHARWNEHPFGSGPFRVVRWRRAEEIVLEPNPYARRKPKLLRLVLKIVPDRNSELLELRTHAVDVVDALTDVQVAEAPALRDIRLVRTQENSIAYLAFNTQRPPTNDVRVRRALLDAIDTRMIAKNAYHGFWPIATTEIPPVLDAHDLSIPISSYLPQRAARFLAASAPHVEVQLVYNSSNEESQAIATTVQENLARAGVMAVLHGYPSTVYFRLADGVYYGGRFNLAFAGYSGGSDPEQSEFWTCDRRSPRGPNAQRWCDPTYDRLFLEQSQLLDQSRRVSVFFKMQATVSRAAIFVPLVYQGIFSALNPAVRGWNPNMLFEFANSEEWDVVPPRRS